jgi:hypothetical protein
MGRCYPLVCAILNTLVDQNRGPPRQRDMGYEDVAGVGTPIWQREAAVKHAHEMTAWSFVKPRLREPPPWRQPPSKRWRD